MLALSALILATETACVGYLARAGCGQLEILWNRRPIPEVLADSATPEEVRAKLEHVQRVREFALDQMGLHVAETFTEYSHLDRSAVAWNVSASEQLRLKAKTWWFPIVGEVPYLGFFSRDEAEDLQSELAAEGWDAIVTTVAAYSTLGWFDDPLVSPQMRYSERQLAELLIHESSHATLWFPGDVGFNESFASFVGREGALQYYREKYGANSSIYRAQLAYLEESNELSLILRQYAKKLNDTYNQNKTDDWKRESRYRLLQELRAELIQKESAFRYLNLKRLSEREWNNAHFLSHLRYESGESFFAAEFAACGREWDCFLKRMHALNERSPAERRALLENARQ
ncbi:MAG: aminopeptidase [bacterium]|nr:aminopeptidase [bacterium]